ncbi:MAG: hypothetical protein PHT69_16755 [Bacteroidales bacterium]|nr:hypothetical protein [Bacteroidales bacterium]
MKFCQSLNEFLTLNSLKNYILFTLFWLTITLATAVSLVFWNQNKQTYLTVFKTAKNYAITFFNGTESSEQENFIEVSENIIKKKFKRSKARIPSAEDLLRDSLSVADSLYLLSLNLDSLNLLDSLYNTDFSYNIGENDNRYSENTDREEGIVVMRDRLLFSKNIEAKIISENQNSRNNLDSLLIGGRQSRESKIFNVEFWESPLNSKGYKRTRNKIVLYGIRDADLISLLILDNVLYLSYFNDFYVINNSPTFQQFLPFANNQIINQLKEQ